MKNWKEHLSGPDGNALKPRTLVEVYGKTRVLVEQHRGIFGYGTDCIRIGTTYGILVVEGDDLRLCCMSRTQVVIRGQLLGLRLEEN